ncbi:VOC family protein [Streptomyces sp. MS1.AVA.3]|uniref:VOC family protein n=1 Tax=Streptomyces decoyicus TaxID=249567 RepID=UPI0030C149BA
MPLPVPRGAGAEAGPGPPSAISAGGRRDRPPRPRLDRPPPPGPCASAPHYRAEILGELGTAPDGYRSLVVLRVNDLDGYCAQLTGRGAVLAHGPAPMTDRMRVAHLKDPDGNIVELQQWLELRGAV